MKTRRNLALPEHAILELTYDCNHQCRFCYCPWENTVKPEFFYEKQDELPLEGWKKVLAALEDIGVKNVGLSGGEPLLKEGFVDLLKHIRGNTGLNKGRKISVISNGKSMNEHTLSALKEAHTHLQLSLPGLTTYAWHTGTAGIVGGAENLLYWLKRAKEEGISTTVNIIVTRRNLHELYEMIANAILAGAGSLMLNRALIGGRGIGHIDELTLSKEEIREMVDTAEDVLKTAGHKGAIGTEIPLCALDEAGSSQTSDGEALISSASKYSHLRIASLCAAARKFFVIDPSGYVRTCNHSPRRLGHILDSNPIEDATYWNLFASRAYSLPEMCADCSLYNKCDCGCREAASICYGELDAPDPSMK